MNRFSRARTPAKLSESVHKQLNMYALAAGAAGVGMLALSQPAEAKIVYTPVNIQISGKPLPIDLNHDGVVDFFLFHYGFHTSTGGNALLACLDPFFNGTRTVCVSSSLGKNALNAFRVVESNGAQWGAAVKPGGKIVGGDQFRSGHYANMGQVAFPTSSQKPRWGGPWVDGGKGTSNRYVGIKFQINGRFHFGWARVTVKTQGTEFTATLTGYAYETIAGKGIIAGQTKGTDDISEPDATVTLPSPGSATLGALALGATGVSIWRREEVTGQ